jgi:hypothetical protein|tara:strand:- start:95 stop:325 length:231 start_codon:yes stop_codon:yes gene_type:complete
MDFKDIKTWGVLLSIVGAIGGGFAKFGEISNRLTVLEGKSFPDVKQMELNRAEIEVIKAKIDAIKARSDNPLGGGL